MDGNNVTCPDLARLQEHVNTLTKTQRQFSDLLLEWLRNPRHLVVVVTGGPGTGKTYSVIETLERYKCNQTRMAPTGRIAEKIGGKTIHSTFKLDWRRGSVMHALEEKFADSQLDMLSRIEESDVLQEVFCPLNPFPRIAVIDEVGMMPFWLTIQIITYLIKQSCDPILIVLMGDKHQLKPVKTHENLFDVPFLKDRFETKFIELAESMRFEPEYQITIQKLRDYVDREDEEGLFDFVRREFPIVESIEGDILKQCNRVLAFQNTTVKNYNTYYINKMVKGNPNRMFRVYKGTVYWDDYVDFKKGCLVFVTQTTSLIKNGTPARFDSWQVDFVQITTLKDNNVVRIDRDIDGRFPLVVGFASTVHKFQGDTIDDPNIAICFNECKDLNLVYTALSRVKSKKQIRAIQL